MNGAPKQVENVGCGSVDAALGAGDLRGVAGQEVVHRLRRGELAIGGSTPNASAVRITIVVG